MTWKDFELYTYEYILSQALQRVPNTVDKREGSIIYDALAPMAYEMAELMILAREAVMQRYLAYGTGDYLDEKAREQGLTRYPSTQAVLIAEFKDTSNVLMDVPVGVRFSSINVDPMITYIVTEKVSTGIFKVKSEQYGETGNAYIGEILPLTNINNLGYSAITSIDTLARHTETDDELRQRIIDSTSQQPFGGNVMDYDLLVRSQSGVGDAQIYPVWNGGGTVKISVVGSNFMPIDNTKVTELQQLIDPTQDGMGIGLAPIGHQVTVVAPTATTIDIVADIAIAAGFTIAQIQAPAEEIIGAYIEELRENWGKPSALNQYSLSVYRSRITSALLEVAGVENVVSVTINGVGADFVLTQDASTQQVPVFGTLTLS